MSGAILRKKREELGLDMKQVAEQLRIRADYLSAIEQDLFDKLPAPVYTMGYIRSYARHLDVDPTTIIAVYAERLPKPKTDTPAIPVVLAEKRRPYFLYLVLIVIAGAIGAGVYFRLPSAPDLKQAEKTAPQPAAKPSATVQHQAPPVEKTTTPDLKAKTEAPSPEPAKIKAPAAAPSVPVAIGQERKAPEPAATGQDMHLLSIQATETSWIYVKFKNGKYESVTLRPGSSRQWSFAESTYLKIGNAGGVKVTLDGRELGQVGQSGQVVILTLPQQPQ